MLKKLKNRFFAGLAIIVALFVFLTAGLGNLTLAQGGDLTTQSESKKVRTLSVKGSRGQITDNSGIPLAYDQSSYDIQFVRDPSKNSTTDKSYYTDVLMQTIEIIEQNGGTTIDTFAIKRQDDGTFAFDFGITDEEAVKTREERWRTNMFASKTADAAALYSDMRTRYRIPEEYTYEQARKLLSIWQEVQLSSYRAYEPITICSNVDMDTVAAIEAKADQLDGIQVAESAVRVYPKDSVAAHIIGYMGKMVDEDTVKEYQDKGYSSEDKIGVAGIESTMEQYLTGNSTEKQGTRQVEVDSKGKVIKEVSSTPAISGSDVRLTLDLDLQMEAERAIEANVKSVYEEQVAEYNDPENRYDRQGYVGYDTKLDERSLKEGQTTNFDKLNLAQSGALIVMDVNTGKILAMASYPSYDLNIFSGGVSEEQLKELQDDKTRPMFNNAISSTGIPGSIFKMVTGLAGLMEGDLGLHEEISDMGLYNIDVQEGYTGDDVPACWAYVKGMSSVPEHANQDIVLDLEHSCNYFFYEVAHRTGVDNLVKWGEQFGLTSTTGIELTGEAVGAIGNQETLYDKTKSIDNQKTSLPALVRSSLITFLRDEVGEEGRDITYTDEQLKTTAEKLIQLVDPDNTQVGSQIRAILSEELQIPETVSSNKGWDNQINGIIAELRWNPIKTIISGIGSGSTTITPIAAARYVAAIANSGTVYEAHVVDSILDSDGNVVEQKEPVVYNKIDAPEEYFEALRDGMSKVVSGEDTSAGDIFKGWPYENDIAGKTGSGKVSNIDLETNAWFVAFAPKDDPEIAVVSYIPNGMSGSHAIPAAKDIIQYYLDGKQQEEANELPSENTLIP